MTALAAVVLLGAAFEGYLWRVGVLRGWVRAVFGAAGLLLFIPEANTDILGVALAAGGFVAAWLARAGGRAAGA